MSLSKQIVRWMWQYDNDTICDEWADLDLMDCDYIMFKAAKSGNLSVVRYLALRGAEIQNNNAMLSAAMNNHSAVVQYLKSIGTNVYTLYI